MNTIIKTWMLMMIDTELTRVEKSIKNNEAWADSSQTSDMAEMFRNNAFDLETYKTALVNLRKLVVEEQIDV